VTTVRRQLILNELELLKKRQEDNIAIRSKASAYAKKFLAQKYYDEYKELYDAYLRNRGYSTRANKRTNIIDEREVNVAHN
jgi:hypothetical protein